MTLLTNIVNISKLLPNSEIEYNVVCHFKRFSGENFELKILTGAKRSNTENSQLANAAKDAGPSTIVANTNEKSNEGYGIKRYTENIVEDGFEYQAGARNFVPTFNLAAYVDKSPSLHQLIHMGVDFNSIERRKGLAQFVLKLDFERDIKPYLVFLNDQGVAAQHFGEIITKNPLLFKMDINDLHTCINYLESKKFQQLQVQRILTINPFWLMFSTTRIDRRLGHFQKEFRLTGDDVRFLASKQPRLITYNMEHILKSTFCIREEMGFDEEELKCLLLGKPRLWMMKTDQLIERFAYAHQQMELSHNMLIQFPEVLTSRLYRLRDRHEFLKLVGRAQYDPEKDLYISPRAVVEGTDYYFVKNIAKTDFNTYKMFLLTK